MLFTNYMGIIMSIKTVNGVLQIESIAYLPEEKMILSMANLLTEIYNTNLQEWFEQRRCVNCKLLEQHPQSDPICHGIDMRYGKTYTIETFTCAAFEAK